jgi:pimeloyl-ACP methyl ester carboxylesterase
MRRCGLLFLATTAALVALPLRAQPAGEVVDLPARTGVTERMLVLRPATAPASVVVLLNGGSGLVGIYPNGSLQHDGNFLVRSRDRFVRAGHAVIVLDTPSDQRELRGSFRDSPEHAADLGAAIAWARRAFRQPVWLVGTSRGTHSAANAAVRLQGEQAPDGIVLTSTILESNRFGASTAQPVQQWPLEQLRMPVLVMHHREDQCQVTPPARLPELMRRLRPEASELITYGGGTTRGPFCEAFAHHGFAGLEDKVVADMSAWIGAHP